MRYKDGIINNRILRRAIRIEVLDENGEAVLGEDGKPLLNKKVMGSAVNMLNLSIEKEKTAREKNTSYEIGPDGKHIRCKQKENNAENERPICIIYPDKSIILCKTREEAAKKTKTSKAKVRNTMLHNMGIANGYVLIFADRILKIDKNGEPLLDEEGKFIIKNKKAQDLIDARLELAIEEVSINKTETIYVVYANGEWEPYDTEKSTAESLKACKRGINFIPNKRNDAVSSYMLFPASMIERINDEGKPEVNQDTVNQIAIVLRKSLFGKTSLSKPISPSNKKPVNSKDKIKTTTDNPLDSIREEPIVSVTIKNGHITPCKYNNPAQASKETGIPIDMIGYILEGTIDACDNYCFIYLRNAVTRGENGKPKFDKDTIYAKAKKAFNHGRHIHLSDLGGKNAHQ